MFDALTKLFEGKNINQEMASRNQIKNMNIQHLETIQSYFTRVSHIKEQLEAIEENVEGEIMLTTLNGLPRSWDSFIQGICARKKLIKFSRLWEECTQEEARLVSKEEKMGVDDDQAFASHAKKDQSKREDQPQESLNDSKRIKDLKTLLLQYQMLYM